MKKHVAFASVLMTIALVAMAFVVALPCAAKTTLSKPFMVFNSLHYRDTPDLSEDGLHNIRLIYENKLTTAPTFGIGQRTFNAASIAAMASQSKNEPNIPVSLDIESWALNSGAMQKYVESVRVFRHGSPHSKIGLYGFIPYANKLLYQSIDKNNPKLRERWESMQAQTRPVADSVDIFMPSLYTWGKNMDAWESTAKIAIKLARATNPNKPVYAYIWPQYYSNDEPYALEFIDAKTWRIELETLYQLADGVIIWSSDKDSQGKPIKFSRNMPWYIETLNFVKQHNLH